MKGSHPREDTGSIIIVPLTFSPRGTRGGGGGRGAPLTCDVCTTKTGYLLVEAINFWEGWLPVASSLVLFSEVFGSLVL